MSTIFSTLFHVLCFPHQGKIVTFDQLAFLNSDSCIGSVPFVENIPSSSYENVGVGLLKDSTLIGNFPLPPPKISPSVPQINMISTGIGKSLGSYDPWVIPTPNEYDNYDDRMPLSPMELNYEAIQFAYAYTFDAYDRMSPILDEYSHSIWHTSLTSPDPFNDISPVMKLSWRLCP
jgi:hypothetical protein